MAVNNKNSDEKNEKSHWWDSKPLIWGVTLSVIYLGSFIAFLYTFGEMKHTEVGTGQELMSWNEIGDFFAGAAAPLAFIWLVVAVFLQKSELGAQLTELKISTKALENQGVHLKVQAELTKETLEMEKSEASVEALKTKLNNYLTKLINEGGKFTFYNINESPDYAYAMLSLTDEFINWLDRRDFIKIIDKIYYSTHGKFENEMLILDGVGDFEPLREELTGLIEISEGKLDADVIKSLISFKKNLDDCIKMQKEFEKNNP